MGAVGPAKGIAGARLQFVFHGLDIVRRQHGIGVEDQHILSLSPFYTIIAALPRAGVRFQVIMHVEAVGIFLHNAFAGHRRAIFNHHYLEVAVGLRAKALEEFVHFVGTIVNGNDNGVTHLFILVGYRTMYFWPPTM